MAEFKYVVTDEDGIHARPAGMLVKFVKELGCTATISKGGRTVDLTKLMALMSLGVKKGEEVTIASDDAAGLEKISGYLKNNF